MREMVNDRLKQLFTAQECMKNVDDIINNLDRSQLTVEKNAFDVINCSDTSLNLAKEGNQLATKLHVIYQSYNETTGVSEDIANLVNDLGSVFQKILEAANLSNEVSHNMEHEVAFQRDITDYVKNAIYSVTESVNQAISCAETLLQLTVEINT